MNDPSSLFTSQLSGGAPEVAVTRHMLVRGLIAAPLLILIAGFIWGADGAVSSAFGCALVMVNFALAAALISTSAHFAGAHDGSGAFWLSHSVGHHFCRCCSGARYVMDFATGTRMHHYCDAPWSSLLGTSACVGLIGLPRSEAKFRR